MQKFFDEICISRYKPNGKLSLNPNQLNSSSGIAE